MEAVLPRTRCSSGHNLGRVAPHTRESDLSTQKGDLRQGILDQDEMAREHGRGPGQQQRGLATRHRLCVVHTPGYTDPLRSGERDRGDGDACPPPPHAHMAMACDFNASFNSCMADGLPIGTGIVGRDTGGGGRSAAIKALGQRLRLKAMNTFTTSPSATRWPGAPMQ